MKRNSMLDMMKGICILFVIITHGNWQPDERLKYGFPFWIDMAVPFFMIISGYVNTISFQNRNDTSITMCYDSVSIAKKIVYYTVPFAIAFVIENICFLIFHHRQLPSIVELFREFLCGGIGPGSYYYPILIQMVFLFPAVYLLILRNNVKGVVICAVANFLYELLQWAYGMPEDTYRLLIFRYVLLLSFGSYFALGNKLSKCSMLILSGVGIGSIFLISYRNVCPFFIPYWKTTSFLPALFPVSLFALVCSKKIHNRFLETIGKASYHIFLTQMVYFMFAYLIYERVANRGVQMVANVVICLIFGIMFYKIERPISNLVISKFDQISKRAINTD